jgi:hypothetical protein
LWQLNGYGVADLSGSLADIDQGRVIRISREAHFLARRFCRAVQARTDFSEQNSAALTIIPTLSWEFAVAV